MTEHDCHACLGTPHVSRSIRTVDHGYGAWHTTCFGAVPMSGMLSRTIDAAVPCCDPPRAPAADVIDSPRMRIVKMGRRPIVEVITSLTQNRLYEAYRALRAHGVQVIHTAVRRSGDTLVQLLHLAEADGSELSTRRLRETLATLRRECGVTLMRSSRHSVQAWIEPAAAAICW